MQAYTLQTLIDEAEIKRLIETYYLGLDTKAFERVRGTLADEIVILGDYRDPMDEEGEARGMTADEWVDMGPRRYLSGFDATAHISSNHIISVEGDSAHVRLTLYANHFVTPTAAEQAEHGLSAQTISCVDYIFIEYWLTRTAARGWLIHKMRSRIAAETGDPALAFGISLKRSGREAA